MSAFDTQINVIQTEVGPVADPQEPENFAGAEIRLNNAIVIPTEQGLAPIPIGSYRFVLTKGALEQFIAQLEGINEILVAPKKRPNIQIASSLAEVEGEAARAQQLHVK